MLGKKLVDSYRETSLFPLFFLSGKASSKKEREKEKEKARERESQLERQEFDSQLHIAESLAIARDSRARELASSLYKSLLESFNDQTWREESLRGLAEKALQKERENSLEILAEIVSREGQVLELILEFKIFLL